MARKSAQLMPKMAHWVGAGHVAGSIGEEEVVMNGFVGKIQDQKMCCLIGSSQNRYSEKNGTAKSHIGLKATVILVGVIEWCSGQRYIRGAMCRFVVGVNSGRS